MNLNVAWDKVKLGRSLGGASMYPVTWIKWHEVAFQSTMSIETKLWISLQTALSVTIDVNLAAGRMPSPGVSDFRIQA
jgi:hypothetical protein